MMGDTDDHRHLFDIVEKMLEYDTTIRIPLEEAIRHPFFDKLTPEQRGLPKPKPAEPAEEEEDRERSHSLSR